MITGDRRCDCCNTRTVCQAAGDMRWYCSQCFESRTGFPWERRRRPVRKSYQGNAPVSGKEPRRTDSRERARDAKRGLS